MTHGLYLVSLLLGIAGCTIIDAGQRLVWWHDWRRALRTILLGVGLFVVWDIAGIVLSVFSIGKSVYIIGLRIGQFPVEELFFLYLFVYVTLLVGEGVQRWRSR